MNALEFRSKGEYRIALADLLSNEVLQQAIAIITADDIGKDALVDADPIVSVRTLSQRVGREQAFTLLQELAMPIPDQQTTPPETFGTKHTVDDFDQLNPSYAS
jgi:hypothetical protein